jgi:hypothetical protein
MQVCETIAIVTFVTMAIGVTAGANPIWVR